MIPVDEPRLHPGAEAGHQHTGQLVRCRLHRGFIDSRKPVDREKHGGRLRRDLAVFALPPGPSPRPDLITDRIHHLAGIGNLFLPLRRTAENGRFPSPAASRSPPVHLSDHAFPSESHTSTTRHCSDPTSGLIDGIPLPLPIRENSASAEQGKRFGLIPSARKASR